MSIPITVVAIDPSTANNLASLIPTDTYTTTTCTPDALPADLPQMFVLSLPGIDTPEEKLIEQLRSDDTTAGIPIVIVSQLPMIELQSVPYASDWTIAIVEEPVDPDVLKDTMHFLLNPEG